MRLVRAVALGACTLFAAGCSGPAVQDEPEGPPLNPGGYQIVLDPGTSSPGQFVTAETPDGVRLTTGPAGIAWRPQDVVPSGDFRVEGALTLHGAPVGYREGFGIFVGGRALDGATPSYLYLLVRASGEYMVRRRVGEATETLLDWLPHTAVQRVGQDGETPENTLAIETRGEETRFFINGIVVFVMPSDEARPWGTTGLRINHRLDLTLTRWDLGPPPADSTLTSGS